jgi:hypothetical protein
MLKIDELVLRIPGLREGDCTDMANDIVKRIADGLPHDLGNHKIPELKIRMEQRHAKSPGQMADNIATQIINQIKLATL